MDIYKELKKGDIVIDCGAHIGNSTERLANTGATVYAFEPEKRVYTMLQKRFEDWANVICINKGLWSFDGVLPLYLHNNAHKSIKRLASSSFISTHINVNKDKFVAVGVMDVAYFIEGRKIKFFKINAEGAELEILSVLLNTGFINYIDFMCVAFHVRHIKEVDDRRYKFVERILNAGFVSLDENWKETNTNWFRRIES